MFTVNKLLKSHLGIFYIIFLKILFNINDCYIKLGNSYKKNIQLPYVSQKKKLRFWDSNLKKNKSIFF